MSPIIYVSPRPEVQLASRSLFTHLFAPSNGANSVGNHPASDLAFIDGPSGAAITRGQLRHLALSFAYGLRHHANTKAKVGETVLIYSPNSLHWPVVLFGAVAAGVRLTLANSAYTSRELGVQYKDSGARLVFTSQAGLPAALEMFKELGIDVKEAEERIVILSPSFAWAGGPPTPRKSNLLHFEDLLEAGVLDQEENFDGESSNETVLLCYSSGTTGKPKGVETTHQNVTTVLDISVANWFGSKRIIGVLPFYHIYGSVMLLQYSFYGGAAVIIQSHFDPVQFCAAIEKYKIDTAMIVPPVLVALARHPAVDKYDLSSLQDMISGAAPLGPALAHEVVKRLLAKRGGKGKVRITQGYGLTETSPATHLLPGDDAARKIGSVGLLLSNLEARLVDPDTGLDVLPGNRGELWIRGRSVMKGYLNQPAETADAITKDKWFKTGDVAEVDQEGYWYIVDRKKELIKYKGFQVPPAELEGVLLEHPEVADAAVIGVYSIKEATELPRAYVVAAHPGRLESSEQKAALVREIQKWIETRVAKHKFLRGGVVIIDVIPKSAAGKILRRDLQQRAKTELAGTDPGVNLRAML